MRPLRHAVLRAGMPPEEVVWPGDDDPSSAHAGILSPAGEPVAVGSLVRAPLPGRADDGRAWRVRGMAVAPEQRRRGLGGMVLASLLRHAEAQDAAVVWCHARVLAVALYERAGFVAVGEPYEHGPLGLHRLLVATLTPR